MKGVTHFLQKFTVGLNFAEEKEAAKFYQAVEAKLQEREKRASECNNLL